jgi:hypothetical protein
MSRETSTEIGKRYGLQLIFRVLEFTPLDALRPAGSRIGEGGVLGTGSDAARSPKYRAPICWRPFAPIWKRRPSPAKVTASSGHASALGAISVSPAPACCV